MPKMLTRTLRNVCINKLTRQTDIHKDGQKYRPTHIHRVITALWGLNTWNPAKIYEIYEIFEKGHHIPAFWAQNSIIYILANIYSSQYIRGIECVFVVMRNEVKRGMDFQPTKTNFGEKISLSSLSNLSSLLKHCDNPDKCTQMAWTNIYLPFLRITSFTWLELPFVHPYLEKKLRVYFLKWLYNCM